MKNSNILTLKNLSKAYNGRQVLNNISFNIAQGDFTAIVGKSGSGKSTLLNIIALFEKPDSGKYYLNGKDLTKRFVNAAKIRNEMLGFVFQSYCLVPNRNVRDNILMPLMFRKSEINKTETLNWYEELLRIFDIKSLEMQTVNTLSGGEKQRVAIARALIMKPSIILADEPTGNLDEENSDNIMEIFSEINKRGYTIIFVTHDKGNADRAKRLLKLENGVLHDQFL